MLQPLAALQGGGPEKRMATLELLIIDRELQDLIPSSRQEDRSNVHLLVHGRQPESLPYTDLNSSVQPCSLDLHIGKIYVAPDDPNAAKFATAKERHAVGPGKTVVVRTEEELDVPNHIAIIGFPPTSLSSKGILAT
jgi:deoxycytidine triphosphate deaminase